MVKWTTQRVFYCTLSLLLILPLYGCWDNQDIEKLSIVMGIGLDKVNSADKQSIRLTNQIAIPKGSSQEQTSTVNYQNASVTGETILSSFRRLSLELSNPPFTQHLKVIIIQDKLAKSLNMQGLLNHIIRDNESRMSPEVCITKGEARDLLNVKAAPDIPSERITGIVDNQYRTTRILPPMTLGEVNSKLIQKSSFLLQNIEQKDGKLVFNGAGIIKGSTRKLIGFLTKSDLDGLMWIKGEAKGGTVNIKNDKGQLMVYEISSVKQKIHPHVEKGRISFQVNIQSQGRLSEDWTPEGNAFKNQKLKEVERLTKNKIDKRIKEVLDKTQKRYQVDVVDFGNQLRIHYPKTWRRVKGHWEEVFKDVPIDYNVQVKVKSYGSAGSKD
ncbi:Ger(x)C family spore germination protein [Priestia megaterium]|jgi:spore germination protein